MKILCWNLNNRISNQRAWDIIVDFDPDIALLSEVNYVPERLPGYEIVLEYATGHNGRPRNFKTCILIKGRVEGIIDLVAHEEWVNAGLRAFPGNFIARRVSLNDGEKLNVISVHMPSWPFPYREFTEGDVSAVMLPGYWQMHMSELLWAALRRTMPLIGGNWIVGGDFNTSEFIGSTKTQNDANREVIDRMRRLGFIEAVREVSGGPMPSWRSSRPGAKLRHQLDHLYVSDGLRHRMLAARIGAPDKYFPMQLSDHLPLFAEFESLSQGVPMMSVAPEITARTSCT